MNLWLLSSSSKEFIHVAVKKGVSSWFWYIKFRKSQDFSIYISLKCFVSVLYDLVIYSQRGGISCTKQHCFLIENTVKTKGPVIIFLPEAIRWKMLCYLVLSGIKIETHFFIYYFSICPISHRRRRTIALWTRLYLVYISCNTLAFQPSSFFIVRSNCKWLRSDKRANSQRENEREWEREKERRSSLIRSISAWLQEVERKGGRGREKFATEAGGKVCRALMILFSIHEQRASS